MLKHNLRNGFSSVTATVLALHTVLGCCWHHAHRCTQECVLAACVTSPDGCQSDHVDDCGTTGLGGHGHHGHQGRHECQGTTCVFLGPTKSGLQGLSLQLAAPPAVLGPIGGVAVAALPAKPFFAADALLPPLRRHLLDQVLLI